MLTQFIDYISGIYKISDELKERLANDIEIVEIPKRTLILKEGQRSDHVSFVFSGLLRAYYIKNNEEVCSRFMHENHICLSVISFYTRKPGYEFIETLEPTTIARLHNDKLQKIYNDHVEFNYVGRIWTEHYCSMTEQRLLMLRGQSAEEKYQFFMEQFPSLINRLPLKYIASYLGMNIETISRIRKKISMRH